MRFSCQKCTVGQKKKGGGNTSTNFNTNYCREMKLVPFIMDYCLLQFDALKFVLGVRRNGGPLIITNASF